MSRVQSVALVAGAVPIDEVEAGDRASHSFPEAVERRDQGRSLERGYIRRSLRAEAIAGCRVISVIIRRLEPKALADELWSSKCRKCSRTCVSRSLGLDGPGDGSFDGGGGPAVEGQDAGRSCIDHDRAAYSDDVLSTVLRFAEGHGGRSAELGFASTLYSLDRDDWVPLRSLAGRRATANR